MMYLRILRVVPLLVGWMLYMFASVSTANTTAWHTVELRTPPVFSQQVDDDEFEDSIRVTVPSTNAGRSFINLLMQAPNI